MALKKCLLYMKMNYQLQNNRRGHRRFLPVLVVVFFIAIIATLFSFFPLLFPSFSQSIGRPLWVSGNLFINHAGIVGSFFSSRTTLIEKNRMLEKEIADLRTKLVAQSVVEKENKELKELWGRNTDTTSILAAVLMRPPRSVYDTFVLDAGADSGVMQNDIVLSSDTIALGVIDQVFKNTSRAKLFSSVDTHTSAIVSRNNVSVELIGTGGGNFEIRVPQDVDILSGDTIVFPGITPYVVALVEAIESAPADSFKRVFCKVPVHIGELRLVSVTKSSIF